MLIQAHARGERKIGTHAYEHSAPARIIQVEVELVVAGRPQPDFFSSRRKGAAGLYLKNADGTGAEELLYEDAEDNVPTSWSPDRRLLLYWARLRGRGEMRVLPWHRPGRGTTETISVAGAWHDGRVRPVLAGRQVTLYISRELGPSALAKSFPPLLSRNDPPCLI
jgi:hypothetical protein